MQCVSITVSIFSLVLIAVERHQLIINPRGWRPNNRHAYVGIAVIWVLAVASSLPFLIYQVLTDEPFQNVTLDAFKDKYVCFDKFPSDSHRLSYTTLLLVLQYFGPLCFIFICYFKVGKPFPPTIFIFTFFPQEYSFSEWFYLNSLFFPFCRYMYA